jgi:hypothetical protein
LIPLAMLPPVNWLNELGALRRAAGHCHPAAA